MIEVKDQFLHIKGELTKTNCMEIKRQAENLLGEATIGVSLSAVNISDSSGLALLIEWTRRRQLNGVNALSILGAPPSLLSLAKLYGVEMLLDFGNTGMSA